MSLPWDQIDPELSLDELVELGEAGERALGAFHDTLAAFAVSRLGVLREPSSDLKARILAAVEARSASLSDAMGGGLAMVYTDADGRIQWVNGAFTELCGYELHELRGKKPSEMLHGALTEVDAVGRMRRALRKAVSITERVTNYHKDGSTYRVALTINPIRSPDGWVSGYVALEQRIAPAAVGAV